MKRLPLCLALLFGLWSSRHNYTLYRFSRRQFRGHPGTPELSLCFFRDRARGKQATPVLPSC
jgi:hypothetical protein